MITDWMDNASMTVTDEQSAVHQHYSTLQQKLTSNSMHSLIVGRNLTSIQPARQHSCCQNWLNQARHLATKESYHRVNLPAFRLLDRQTLFCMQPAMQSASRTLAGDINERTRLIASEKHRGKAIQRSQLFDEIHRFISPVVSQSPN